MTPITWYLYGRSGGAKKAAEEIGVKETVTGKIASFSDGCAGMPMKSLVAEITPVQSGSGDPSPTNIRPISGRTGMAVTRAGKNLLVLPFLFYNTVPADKGNCFYLPNGTYTFSFVDSTVPSWRFVLRLYGIDGTEVTSGNFASGLSYRSSIHGFTNGTNIVLKTLTFTLDKEYYVRILFWGTDATSDTVFTNTQLEIGSTATEYEPYTAQTYPVTWESSAGTVYGGKLDVVSGVLVVTHGYILLDGTQDIRRNGRTAISQRAFISITDKAFGLTNIQSGRFSIMSPPDAVGKMSGRAANNVVEFFLPLEGTEDTAASCKQWFADNNTQLVYELATPQTYQLTGAEVRTILGGNNIYTDAGDVSVEYVADTKMYIDNKIAELQALVLEN